MLILAIIDQLRRDIRAGNQDALRTWQFAQENPRKFFPVACACVVLGKEPRELIAALEQTITVKPRTRRYLNPSRKNKVAA